MELLSKNVVFEVLEQALSTGCTFAEVFIEHSVKNSLILVNGQVDKAQSGIDFGLGLRLFDGYGAVYTYTNILNKDNLIKIAKEAALAIKNRGAIAKPKGFKEKTFDIICEPKIWPGQMPKKDVIDKLRKSSEKSFAYNSLVTQTNSSYQDAVTDVLIANSEGLWAEDKRSLITFAVSAVASEANEKQTGYFRKGTRLGSEYWDGIDFSELGSIAAEKAVRMLKADLCPGGMMPVVIDEGFGGVIFHEACGHSLEATSVAKGASVFCGKIGEKIASDKVTAVDDGTIKGAWGSINIDDEGTESARNVLIENGVLKSYMVDRLNGLKMGKPATGSSRRESYRYAPTSRMTNTYIDVGTDKQADIIASVDYGLYAKTMGGGSVMPATGDFNFAVNEAYLIENGKITKPVRGATLIGKGADVLKDIEMVSDNLSMEAGFCGSLSGSVPTNVGQPMIKVSNMTVGGR